MKRVVQSGMQFHILLIIADGQVTRGSDVEPGSFSIYEELTLEAIQAARCVGVGGGVGGTQPRWLLRVCFYTVHCFVVILCAAVCVFHCTVCDCVVSQYMKRKKTSTCDHPYDTFFQHPT